MFCGDEVSAIVGDVGTDTSKFGYAGEDLPKAVLPSAVGYVSAEHGGDAAGGGFAVGTAALHCRRDHMALRSPMSEGLLSDWETTEKLWSYGLDELLHVDPKEHPVLATEPSFNTRSNREKYVELIFEKFQVPALYIAKSAVLAAFSLGRSTALVVDCGASSTSVSPVSDGYVLRNAVMRSPLGGTHLTDYFGELLQGAGVEPCPRFAASRRREKKGGGGRRASEAVDIAATFPLTDPSYVEYMRRDVLRDMKETACVTPEVKLVPELAAKMPPVTYELPDGKVVQLGVERYRVPELLMDPSVWPAAHGSEGSGAADAAGALPLHDMLHQSLLKVDVDLRKDMLKSIMLTGGGSLFHYLPERLHHELVKQVPSSAKVQFLNSGPTERRFGAWMGGSILASLGSFQQLWLSKAEYLEHGANVVEQRFV